MERAIPRYRAGEALWRCSGAGVEVSGDGTRGAFSRELVSGGPLLVCEADGLIGLPSRRFVLLPLECGSFAGDGLVVA